MCVSLLTLVFLLIFSSLKNPDFQQLKGLNFPGSQNQQFCRLVIHRSRHLLKPVRFKIQDQNLFGFFCSHYYRIHPHALLENILFYFCITNDAIFFSFFRLKSIELMEFEGWRRIHICHYVSQKYYLCCQRFFWPNFLKTRPLGQTFYVSCFLCKSKSAMPKRVRNKNDHIW